MTLTAPVAMVFSALAFSVMGACAKVASPHYDAPELVFYRSLVTALVMTGVVHLQRQGLRTALLGMHARRSVLGVLSMLLWYYSLAALPLSTAVTLNYLSSVWLAVFIVCAALWLPAGQADAKRVLAVLGGFAGVALVLQPSMAHDQWRGAAAGILSSLLAAIAYLQVSALGQAGEPDARIVFYFSLAGILGGALAMPWGGWHAHTLRGGAPLLGMALAGAVGQLLLTRAYASGGTLVIASLQYLGIVFSVVLGWLLFAEHITLLAIAGMALIVVCGLLANYLGGRPSSRPLSSSAQTLEP